jgi:hypothetical protein
MDAGWHRVGMFNYLSFRSYVSKQALTIW